MAKGDQFYKKGRVEISLAKLKKGGQNFEIVIRPDKAVEYTEGKDVDLRDVLESEAVFSDAQKGMHAPETAMKQFFNTSDPLEVAKIILKDGEIQLTEDYRERVRDEKKRRIIEIIHRNADDPKTGLPHPPQRIEAAMKEAKIHITEFKRAEDQVQEIVNKLRPIIPIRLEKRKLTVNIPAQYAGKAYSMLKNFGTLLKDEWQNDGGLWVMIEIPAGMLPEFTDELNKFTKGEAEIQVLKE